MTACARSRSQSPMHTVDVAGARQSDYSDDVANPAQSQRRLDAEERVDRVLMAQISRDIQAVRDDLIAEVRAQKAEETHAAPLNTEEEPPPRYTAAEWNAYQSKLYEDIDNYEAAAPGAKTFDSLVTQRDSHARYPHSDPG